MFQLIPSKFEATYPAQDVCPIHLLGTRGSRGFPLASWLLRWVCGSLHRTPSATATGTGSKLCLNVLGPWLVGKLENVVVSCNTAHIGGLCISLRHWSMCQYIFVIVCPGNSFYMCCASNIHTFPQIQCSWEYFLHGWSSVSEVVATFKPPCLNCRSFVSSTTNGMSE